MSQRVQENDTATNMLLSEHAAASTGNVTAVDGGCCSVLRSMFQRFLEDVAAILRRSFQRLKEDPARRMLPRLPEDDAGIQEVCCSINLQDM